VAPENPIELTNVDVAPAAAVSLPRRKTPIILASALAVSLVMAAGVFVGYRLLTAAGDPAERMPASVVAFASTDLTPSRDQVRRLSKFTDPKASVEKALAELDAEPDLSGWMGPSVAAGVWVDKSDRPFVLVSLDSKDDAAATKGLTNIRSKEDIGFVVRDGRVLIAAGDEKTADNQAAAEAAWAEAEKSPLAKHGRYTDARKWLSDEQLAVFYVDLAALDRLLEKSFQKLAEEAKSEVGADVDAQISLGMPGEFKAELAGSLIAGVRVENDGYMVRYRNIGGKAQGGMVADALTRLGALPSASDVAAVAQVSGELGSAMSMLPLMFGGFGGFEDEDSGIVEPDPWKGLLTDAELKELETIMAKPESKRSAAEKKRLEELMGKLMAAGGPGRPGDLGGDVIDPGDPWEELSDSFKDATIAVAVSGITETPVFRALIELAKDPEANLKSTLQASQGKDVKVEVSGRAVTVASVSFPAGGAKLADDPLFQKALAGCPASAQIALYANAAKVLPDTARDKIGQVRAIGLWQSVENGEPVGAVRVLIG
jgi:hypothetical protein